MKTTSTHVFFWDGWLSNFHKCKITRDGITFSSSEQAFMYEKAMFFKDYEVAALILKESEPGPAKKLGRKVKNYSDDLWGEVREQIMKDILRDKFFQDQGLKKLLKDTGTKTLVEASPYDRIWGIGMAEHDFGVESECNWKGLNLLGKVLMEVRSEILPNL